MPLSTTPCPEGVTWRLPGLLKMRLSPWTVSAVVHIRVRGQQTSSSTLSAHSQASGRAHQAMVDMDMVADAAATDGSALLISHHVWACFSRAVGLTLYWLPAVAEPRLTRPLDDIVVAFCRGPVMCKRQRGQLMVLPARPLLRVAVPHLGRLTRGPVAGPNRQLPPQQVSPGQLHLVASVGGPLHGGQPALQQHRR